LNGQQHVAVDFVSLFVEPRGEPPQSRGILRALLGRVAWPLGRQFELQIISNGGGGTTLKTLR
jgi:hypothetical protein